jgi:hypothetical protein
MKCIICVIITPNLKNSVIIFLNFHIIKIQEKIYKIFSILYLIFKFDDK